MATRKIVYLSPTVEGKKHDKKLADEVAIEYPAGTEIQQDTGCARICAGWGNHQTTKEKAARR